MDYPNYAAQVEQQMDCDVATLLAMTGWGVARIGETTSLPHPSQ